MRNIDRPEAINLKEFIFQKESEDFYIDGMLVNTDFLDKSQKQAVVEKQSLASIRKRKGSYN